MALTLYDYTIPTFVTFLSHMQNWLDKAAEQGMDEAQLVNAALAADMRPLSAQFQIASDTAKNAAARLTGIDAPVMADTESSFAELKDRCARTIAFLEGLDRAAFDGAEEREVVLAFPGGSGFRFVGADYIRNFAMPNFMFHATTTYAILRAQGVAIGKLDFLSHLGAPQPNIMG